MFPPYIVVTMHKDALTRTDVRMRDLWNPSAVCRDPLGECVRGVAWSTRVWWSAFHRNQARVNGVVRCGMTFTRVARHSGGGHSDKLLRSFFRAEFCSWRTRSRVRPMLWLTSSRVMGGFPSRPKRRYMMVRSRSSRESARERSMS